MDFQASSEKTVNTAQRTVLILRSLLENSLDPSGLGSRATSTNERNAPECLGIGDDYRILVFAKPETSYVCNWEQLQRDVQIFLH
jgi:hypothetical protein